MSVKETSLDRHLILGIIEHRPNKVINSTIDEHDNLDSSKLQNKHA